MEPVDSLEQTVQLLYENKPVKYINGAVSYISGAEIENVPGSNRLNALAGRIPGLSFYNIDGLPGFENSTYRLRGEHTLSLIHISEPTRLPPRSRMPSSA